MVTSEFVFAALLVAGLLAAAVAFGWGQARALSISAALPDEERRFVRRRAVRRLIGCGLLALMAGLLVVQYGLWEYHIRHADVDRLTDEDLAYARLWARIWLAVMLALLAVLALAAVEAFVTRSRTLREFRRLADDRRAMIQRQADRLREERRGP